MTKQAIYLEQNTPITITELPAHVYGGVKTFKSEVYRDGPHLIRIEFDYWVTSPDTFEVLFSYVVAALHYQEHGHFDDCPGSFQGYVAALDPSGSRAFSPGWYRIHMWIKDTPSLHANGSSQSALFAAQLFESRIEDAINTFCCIDVGGKVRAIKVIEVPDSWLSYQLGQGVQGTQIGTSARFVGPDLYDIDFVRPAVMDALGIEAGVSIH